MRFHVLAAFMITALMVTTPWLSVPASASAPMLDNERGVLTIAPVLDRVTPGVVNISVTTRIKGQLNPLLDDPFFRHFFGVPEEIPERQGQSAGSGVIVDANKGHVITNHHVIDNADDVTVTLKDGRKFKAEIIGSDPETDIALLKIEADGLTQVDFDSSSDLRVGDVVIAIGNPFGIGQTVTSGIVSALGRSGLGIEGYEDFIQTDASINPGNSGGALVNTKGKLVGINTAIIGPSGGNVGIGFAVPSYMASSVMEQLIRFGEVRRGRLGVMIQDLTLDISNAMGLGKVRGAIVTSVQKDSPASKAGLEPGDVIIALNGEKLRNSADLRNKVGITPSGDRVKLKVLRNGKPKTIDVTVESMPERVTSADAAVPELGGAAFGNDEDGVRVMAVQQGSPAWRFGLRAGDIIASVNRNRITSVDDLEEALGAADKVIMMNVIRNGSGLFLVIER